MLRVNTETCIGCGACEANCAFGAITVEDGIAVVDDSQLFHSTQQLSANFEKLSFSAYPANKM
ncbi:MAG: ferredoxin [Candidatus Electrothrix sp. ATG2]|nr:ferredoxin [Candidatus Electrothrix sp. ATG2]